MILRKKATLTVRAAPKRGFLPTGLLLAFFYPKALFCLFFHEASLNILLIRGVALPDLQTLTGGVAKAAA
jgi:hypothetical protein